MWIGMKGTALSKLEFKRGDKVMGQIEKNTVSPIQTTNKFHLTLF